MGKYPDSFADLQEQNPAVFAQALPLFDAKADADDATAKLEDQQKAEKLEQSYAARIGHVVEPVIQPLGFDWKIGVGLIACTAAKEVMVSTLGTIYSVGGDDTHESGHRRLPERRSGLQPGRSSFTDGILPAVHALRGSHGRYQT